MRSSGELDKRSRSFSNWVAWLCLWPRLRFRARRATVEATISMLAFRMCGQSVRSVGEESWVAPVVAVCSSMCTPMKSVPVCVRTERDFGILVQRALLWRAELPWRAELLLGFAPGTLRVGPPLTRRPWHCTDRRHQPCGLGVPDRGLACPCTELSLPGGRLQSCRGGRFPGAVGSNALPPP